jgi:hypothetical protein
MKLKFVIEDYDLDRDKRNFIAALKRRGFAVKRNKKHPALKLEYDIFLSSNLVGRLMFSGTLPVRQHLQMYGPSEYFDILRQFVQNY